MNRSVFTRGRFRVSLVTFALVLVLLGSTGFSTVGAKGVASRAHIRYGGTVVLDNVFGNLWNCAFNPYNGADNGVSNGFTYETLYYINPLTNRQTPWLATSYRWGKGNRTLTFSIRTGAKWNDGRPFSAADVLYTFKLIKRYSALDTNGVWADLAGVSQRGNGVTFAFKHPAVTDFWYIGGQTYIVPQHIWSKVKNPVTYIDKNPVATGPMMVQRCSPQDIIYKRNPQYWQKGRPYISTLRVPAFLDNQPGNLYLAEGHANWGCQYIPNIGTYYISRDPAHRHYYYAPVSDIDLYPNDAVFPFNIPAVRQAVSMAINRKRVSSIGVFGYEPPANQAAIVTPTYSSWYDGALARTYNYSYNPQKAIQVLERAGFKRGSNGIFQKGGKRLSFTILGVAGYTDWVSELHLMQEDLRAIGMDVKVDNISGNDQLTRLQNGRFQMGYYFTTGGPGPYFETHNVLSSSTTAPIGQAATSNYERWRDKTTDRLLDQYTKTASSAQQHAIVNQLQAVMLRDAPVIPVIEDVNWFQYDTSQIVGWPTKSDLYAQPGCTLPDEGVILDHLHLK
jgi:peptide/nickel transport system substrate-binding protein